MTRATDPDLPAATLLSAEAHALRNHVATLRSIVRLIDEPEVAQALDDSSRELQVALERAIVLSRVELRDAPRQVLLASHELMRIAIRRAGREGAQVHGDAPVEAEFDDVVVEVPGPWAERLVADLLHHADASGPKVAARDSAAVFRFQLARPVAEPLAAALVVLAAACGGALALDADAATLRLPRCGA